MRALIDMRALFIGLAAAAALSSGARALEPADQAAIRGVAKQQIYSLQIEDMGAAYATLAPSAHKLFPTKEAYMRAMLENFGALVYASDFELGDLRETSKGIAQEVRVSDRRGRPFIAFFFFERSGSDSWSIRQIIMAPLPAEAA